VLAVSVALLGVALTRSLRRGGVLGSDPSTATAPTS
jgi:hypothetical protein